MRWDLSRRRFSGCWNKFLHYFCSLFSAKNRMKKDQQRARDAGHLLDDMGSVAKTIQWMLEGVNYVSSTASWVDWSSRIATAWGVWVVICVSVIVSLPMSFPASLYPSLAHTCTVSVVLSRSFSLSLSLSLCSLARERSLSLSSWIAATWGGWCVCSMSRPLLGAYRTLLNVDCCRVRWVFCDMSISNFLLPVYIHR